VRRAEAWRRDVARVEADYKAGLVSINFLRQERERLLLKVGFHTIQANLWEKNADRHS
jgi:hypothetical protein